MGGERGWGKRGDEVGQGQAGGGDVEVEMTGPVHVPTPDPGQPGVVGK